MATTRQTLTRLAGTLAATLGLTLLAVPAGVSHAAPAAAALHTTPFEARVVQGPDRGAVLAGTLTLRVVDGIYLRGSLVVGPVAPSGVPGQAAPQPHGQAIPSPAASQPALLTSQAVVPVTGAVLPSASTVLLSFDLGNGRTLQTRLMASRAPHLLSGTSAAGVQPTVQTSGPRAGDIVIILYWDHIHFQWKGRSFDWWI